MARLSPEAREEVRSRLLTTAAEHFAAHGLQGANINTISKSAGFAKGTIYNYFPSKDALFAAVIAVGVEQMLANLAPMDDQDGAVRDRLIALATADVAAVRESEGFIKVLTREMMSFRPTTWPLILEQCAPILEAITAILQQGVERGELRLDRPVPEMALVFGGMLSMAYVQHWGSGGVWPTLDAIPEWVTDYFLHGAKAPTQS